MTSITSLLSVVNTEASTALDFLQREEYGEAAERLRAIAGHSPLDFEVHYALATAYRGLGDVSGALSAIRCCVRLRPDDHRAQMLLSTLLLSVGDVRGGYGALRSAFSGCLWDSKTGLEMSRLIASVAALVRTTPPSDVPPAIGSVMLDVLGHGLFDTLVKNFSSGGPLAITPWLTARLDTLSPADRYVNLPDPSGNSPLALAVAHKLAKAAVKAAPSSPAAHLIHGVIALDRCMFAPSVASLLVAVSLCGVELEDAPSSLCARQHLGRVSSYACTCDAGPLIIRPDVDESVLVPALAALAIAYRLSGALRATARTVRALRAVNNVPARVMIDIGLFYLTVACPLTAGQYFVRALCGPDSDPLVACDADDGTSAATAHPLPAGCVAQSVNGIGGAFRDVGLVDLSVQWYSLAASLGGSPGQVAAQNRLLTILSGALVVPWPSSWARHPALWRPLEGLPADWDAAAGVPDASSSCTGFSLPCDGGDAGARGTAVPCPLCHPGGTDRVAAAESTWPLLWYADAATPACARQFCSFPFTVARIAAEHVAWGVIMASAAPDACRRERDPHGAGAICLFGPPIHLVPWMSRSAFQAAVMLVRHLAAHLHTAPPPPGPTDPGDVASPLSVVEVAYMFAAVEQMPSVRSLLRRAQSAARCVSPAPPTVDAVRVVVVSRALEALDTGALSSSPLQSRDDAANSGDVYLQRTWTSLDATLRTALPESLDACWGRGCDTTPRPFHYMLDWTVLCIAPDSSPSAANRCARAHWPESHADRLDPRVRLCSAGRARSSSAGDRGERFDLSLPSVAGTPSACSVSPPVGGVLAPHSDTSRSAFIVPLGDAIRWRNRRPVRLWQALPPSWSTPLLSDADDSVRLARPMRVVILTPDARKHSVSFFLMSLLGGAHLLRTRGTPLVPEYTVISLASKADCDERTSHIAGLAGRGRFFPVPPDSPLSSTAKLTALVCALRPDVIIDAVGHTAGSRLDVACLGPSVAVVSWCGYAWSTGLGTVNSFRITDHIVDPSCDTGSVVMPLSVEETSVSSGAMATTSLYTEDLIRMPGCFLCYCSDTPAWYRGHGIPANFGCAPVALGDMWDRAKDDLSRLEGDIHVASAALSSLVAADAASATTHSRLSRSEVRARCVADVHTTSEVPTMMTDTAVRLRTLLGGADRRLAFCAPAAARHVAPSAAGGAEETISRCAAPAARGAGPAGGTPEADEITDSPSSRGGRPAFGTFNALSKLNPMVLAAWASILNKVPECCLVLKGKGTSCTRSVEHVIEALKRLDVADVESRVVVLSYAENLTDHLQCYRALDVAVDPFPYSGTTTTAEALWMGVPVVTLAPPDTPSRAAYHPLRVTASILHSIGRAEWIADDVSAYVQTVVDLLRDRERVMALRGSLRQEMLSSPFCDASAFAAAMSAALLAAWVAAAAYAVEEVPSSDGAC